jgi:hypothetical protein
MTVGMSPGSCSPKCGVVATAGSSTKSWLRRGNVMPLKKFGDVSCHTTSSGVLKRSAAGRFSKVTERWRPVVAPHHAVGDFVPVFLGVDACHSRDQARYVHFGAVGGVVDGSTVVAVVVRTVVIEPL